MSYYLEQFVIESLCLSDNTQVCTITNEIDSTVDNYRKYLDELSENSLNTQSNSPTSLYDNDNISDNQPVPYESSNNTYQSPIIRPELLQQPQITPLSQFQIRSIEDQILLNYQQYLQRQNKLKQLGLDRPLILPPYQHNIVINNIKTNTIINEPSDNKTCIRCNKRFNTTKEYLVHMRTHSISNKCSKCDYICRSVSALNKHVCKSLFTCHICNARYVIKTRFEKHMSSHRNFDSMCGVIMPNK